MDKIALWLKQLIAALFLVGFLEMIIPHNEMKGVAKMVMGLVIIMILIQPLAHIFNKSPELIWSISQTSAIYSQSNRHLPSTGQILKQGLEIRDNWTQSLKKNNQQILESKIKNIIGMIDEITLCNLSVDYDGENLKKACLVVRPADSVNVTPALKGKIKRKIFNSLELIAGLSSKQVEVVWE